ncbi:MAG: mannose-1-phosphate guanylyltransferase/mannose-6-phosphate isomerase [Desulfobacterales bacterium]|nr:mannose-1-phosphate guanylyltransferase/mannose-6-phosphate isomerase [Desulfobacterales bacterium]
MSEADINTYAVLLAGGSGTRLWPVSRELYPKQLVNFIGRDSLVQSTVKRLAPVIDSQRLRIVCGQEHFHEMRRHMLEINVPADGKIICEPCGRNTAPAILLAARHILMAETDAVLCVFPADHMVKNIAGFHERLETAIGLAQQGHIVTFGIQPHYPETGYGYIQADRKLSHGARTIGRFVEKPDLETARQYIRAGNFFWNSGMFAFKASVILDEFRTFAPELFEKMSKITFTRDGTADPSYATLPNISFDYAIMEHTSNGVLLVSDFGWSDIGSWKSLYDFLRKDARGNVVEGDVITEDTQNCFIMGHERLIATNGLDNMVVVETPDAVFVSGMESSGNVKAIVTRLKETGRKECITHRKVYYSWGNRTLLEQKNDSRVYRVVINAGAAFQDDPEPFSVQHLIVVDGQARMTPGQHPARVLKTGESAVIGKGGNFLIENTEEKTLCIIQVKIT